MEYKELLDEVIDDSYKRLIMPSIENEIRTDLFSMAENTSIEVFKSNLKELLLCLLLAFTVIPFDLIRKILINHKEY